MPAAGWHVGDPTYQSKGLKTGVWPQPIDAREVRQTSST